METRYSNSIRWGVVTLPIIAILDLSGILLRGPALDAATNAQGFAQSAIAPNFGTAWLLILAGLVISLLSYLALRGALTQTQLSGLPFAAMLLSLIGTALFVSLIGFMAFSAPVAAKLYLQGNTNMNDVIVAGFFGGPVTGVLYTSGSLEALGSILFGIAIWRSGTLPKWTAIPYALSNILLAFAPAFSFTLELLGALLLLVAGAWIAASVWRSANANAHTSPAIRAPYQG